MDHPGLWAGIHHRLTTAIAHASEPDIQPQSIVAIDEAVYAVSRNASVLDRFDLY
ncbi:MAG: DUF4058 family protein [Leptolyngbyaceae cyanobacterium]